MFNFRWFGILSVFVAFAAGNAAAQSTFFSTGFEYAIEPEGLLEAVELNGATGQIGMWNGDDFPEAAAEGFFSGGFIGGDSAGFVDNPHGGRLLYVDRPLDHTIQFMNLTETIPTSGVAFSFTAGLAKTGLNGAADIDLFGLDADGNESFRVRLSADAAGQRLGYVSDGAPVFDLPTASGADSGNDFAPATVPLGVADNLANVTLTIGDDGFVIDYANLNQSKAYTSSLLPFNGTANELDRIALFYRGSELGPDRQSGFYLDNLSVANGAEPPAPPLGNLIGAVNPDGKIVLRGDGHLVRGLEFNSEAGLLVPIPPGDNTANPAPWQVLLANTPHQVVLGSVGSTVTVDGELVTPVGYTGETPETELKANWGNEASESVEFTVLNPEPIPFSGYVNADGKIVLSGNGQELLGLELVSPSGLLVPAPNDSAVPFQFAIENSSSQVVLGNVGFTTTIDGDVATDIGYVGDDPATEIIASWGGADTISRRFTITGTALSLDCNGDGVVDEGDLSCICETPTSLNSLLATLNLEIGDLNLDGSVEFLDFLIMSGNFGTQGDYLDGDLNCDGNVEFADFLELSSVFGVSSNAETVPEPHGMLMLLGGLLLGFTVRKRRQPAS